MGQSSSLNKRVTILSAVDPEVTNLRNDLLKLVDKHHHHPDAAAAVPLRKCELCRKALTQWHAKVDLVHSQVLACSKTHQEHCHLAGAALSGKDHDSGRYEISQHANCILSEIKGIIENELTYELLPKESQRHAAPPSPSKRSQAPSHISTSHERPSTPFGSRSTPASPISPSTRGDKAYRPSNNTRVVDSVDPDYKTLKSAKSPKTREPTSPLQYNTYIEPLQSSYKGSGLQFGPKNDGHIGISHGQMEDVPLSPLKHAHSRVSEQPTKSNKTTSHRLNQSTVGQLPDALDAVDADELTGRLSTLAPSSTTSNRRHRAEPSLANPDAFRQSQMPSVDPNKLTDKLSQIMSSASELHRSQRMDDAHESKRSQRMQDINNMITGENEDPFDNNRGSLDAQIGTVRWQEGEFDEESATRFMSDAKPRRVSAGESGQAKVEKRTVPTGSGLMSDGANDADDEESDAFSPVQTRLQSNTGSFGQRSRSNGPTASTTYKRAPSQPFRSAHSSETATARHQEAPPVNKAIHKDTRMPAGLQDTVYNPEFGRPTSTKRFNAPPISPRSPAATVSLHDSAESHRPRPHSEATRSRLPSLNESGEDFEGDDGDENEQDGSPLVINLDLGKLGKLGKHSKKDEFGVDSSRIQSLSDENAAKLEASILASKAHQVDLDMFNDDPNDEDMLKEAIAQQQRALRPAPVAPVQMKTLQQLHHMPEPVPSTADTVTDNPHFENAQMHRHSRVDRHSHAESGFIGEITGEVTSCDGLLEFLIEVQD